MSSDASIKDKTIRLLLLPPAALFVIFAYRFNYTQDDAFISYRYVANYLNGNGLVYNIGERIEGITNFGWTIFMTLWGAVGVDYIFISKLTGVLFGVATIWVTCLIARMVFDKSDRWLALLPAYILGVNLSLVYWATSGLETTAFALFVALSLYWYLKKSRWLIFALLIAVWLRPEGALVAGILVVVELIMTRRLPRFTLLSGLIAFILSLPYVAFKYLYYGSLLPNPFYAKTGFSWLQITNGAEYTGRFLFDYGLMGLALVVPLLFFRKLSVAGRSVWLFMLIFTVYITLVGGDVLEVHRFFIPLLGVNAILLITTLYIFIRKQKRKIRITAMIIYTLIMMALTWSLPYDYVTAYRNAGTALNRKMTFLADQLKTVDSTNFSVALTTIGAFGNELVGHDIIDMIGLTDTVISRHSEPPIEGITSDWRERKLNTSYLLQRAPDYILFSTGIKPTSPGEKALCLAPQFLESYRTIGWSYRAGPNGTRSSLLTIFKKMRPVAKTSQERYPVKYIEYFKHGLDMDRTGDFRSEIAYYDSAMMVSPKPYNPYLRYRLGLAYLRSGKADVGLPIIEKLIRDDSLIFEAHRELYAKACLENDSLKASIHERWLKKLVPWYWPRAKELAEEKVRLLYRLQKRKR